MRDLLLILAGFCFGTAVGVMLGGYTAWLSDRLCAKCKKYKKDGHKMDGERSENGRH